MRSRYSAVNRRRFGFATTSGSGRAGGALAPALGTSSLRSSPPNAGAGSPFNVIEFLSTAIGSHLPPPYCNSKGCGCLTYVGREGARRFQFVPLWGILVFFLYAMRRVDCRRCGMSQIWLIF